MTVPDLANGLQRELKRRKYFVRMEILDQTLSLIKARLYISPDLFVQILSKRPLSDYKPCLDSQWKQVICAR